MFQEIFSRNAPALVRYLRRLTGSRVTAEDLAQETFLRLHVHLTGGGALESPRAWLFRVATNLALDRAKAEMRADVRDQQYAATRPVDIRQQYERRRGVTEALRGL